MVNGTRKWIVDVLSLFKNVFCKAMFLDIAMGAENGILHPSRSDFLAGVNVRTGFGPIEKGH
jgi:hypothetical protein